MYIDYTDDVRDRAFKSAKVATHSNKGIQKPPF